MGPLLFLVFINDIVCDIDACIKLFADDTSLYVIVDTPDNAAAILNSDIDKIHSWASQWLVRFNAQKTEAMLISRKYTRQAHPSLQMNHIDIQEVLCHKHLGIYFSDDGSWHQHIDYIVKKAFSRVNALRRVRFILDRFTLEKMYFSFIRPILEYGDIVWDTGIQLLVNKIESVQLEAMRIVTGGTKLTSLDKLYEETGWVKLSDRRKKHKLVMLYKMIHGGAPEYLSNYYQIQGRIFMGTLQDKLMISMILELGRHCIPLIFYLRLLSCGTTYP